MFLAPLLRAGMNTQTSQNLFRVVDLGSWVSRTVIDGGLKDYL
jgi:hypothetical protein